MDSGSADFWVGAENCQAAQEQAASGSGAGGGQGASTSGFQRRKGGKGATQTGGTAQAGSSAGSGAQDCGNHSFLGQQSSSSFVDTQQPFEVTYGSGAVAGTIITDNVNLAGLALNNHTFGTAQQETQQFTGVLCFILTVDTTISDC
jgi:Eukaryotic aspartyl protease